MIHNLCTLRNSAFPWVTSALQKERKKKRFRLICIQRKLSAKWFVEIYGVLCLLTMLSCKDKYPKMADSFKLAFCFSYKKDDFRSGGKGFFFLNDGFILIIPVTWYMSKFGIPKIRWMNNPRNLMYARVSLCLLMFNAFFLKQYIKFLNRDKINNKCFIVWKLLNHNKFFFINLLFFEILI